MPNISPMVRRTIESRLRAALRVHGSLANAHRAGEFPRGMTLPSLRSLLSHYGISSRKLKPQKNMRAPKPAAPRARKPKPAQGYAQRTRSKQAQQRAPGRMKQHREPKPKKQPSKLIRSRHFFSKAPLPKPEPEILRKPEPKEQPSEAISHPASAASLREQYRQCCEEIRLFDEKYPAGSWKKKLELIEKRNKIVLRRNAADAALRKMSAASTGRFSDADISNKW